MENKKAQNPEDLIRACMETSREMQALADVGSAIQRAIAIYNDHGVEHGADLLEKSLKDLEQAYEITAGCARF